MRLSSERLLAITGRKQRAAQCRWFLQHYGVKIPSDQEGPIITEDAFNDLVKKSCGVLNTNTSSINRPNVKLRKAA